ncbi:hypothetical protein J5X84_41925 [Streptosporangiaceae bacterium NEAU-GS5]|nr:hypothetical protein [Streptosporangiaceae bacterium NEAU-GS5]
MKPALAILPLLALLVPAPAQAAPVSPVKALKAQFMKGRGVRFTEFVTLSIKSAPGSTYMRAHGAVAFGRHGSVASKNSATYKITLDFRNPVETIRIGETCYTRGGRDERRPLPSTGKSWLKRYDCHSSEPYSGQVLDVTDPDVLALLLRTTNHSRNTYRGKLSVLRLAKVSPGVEAVFDMRPEDGTVSYVLSLGKGRLPEHLTTTWQARSPVGPFVFTVDTEYSGWGSSVRISAPPASHVTTIPKKALPA